LTAARTFKRGFGHVIAALELAQIRELRAQLGDGLCERVAVTLDIEAHRGRGDDWMSRSSNATSAASAMPASRWRTT
jgi:hypothetical protein